MNIFGIRIITPREMKAMVEETEAAMLAKLQEQQLEETADDPRMLESAKFAQEFNKGTSSEMLQTIRVNSKEAERNSKIALYISIPHQALFLLSIIPFAFGSLIETLESITLLGVAFGLPYLGDRLVLMCIRNIATRVISRWDKVKSFAVLIPVTAMSAFLNIKAPGPDLIKWGCGALVALVPLYQIVRSLRPDFAKSGADEVAIRNQIAELSAIDVTSDGVSDEERARRTERARKAAETRRLNAIAKAQAAEISEEEREARRQRGLRAAATRKANAEAKARAAKRKPRKTVSTVADLERDFALADAPVSPAVV